MTYTIDDLPNKPMGYPLSEEPEFLTEEEIDVIEAKEANE